MRLRVYTKLPRNQQLVQALLRQAEKTCQGGLGGGYVRDSIKDPNHKVYVVYDRKTIKGGKYRYYIRGFATTLESPTSIKIDVLCSAHGQGGMLMRTIYNHRRNLKLQAVTERPVLRWYRRMGFSPTNLVSNNLIPHTRRASLGRPRVRYALRSIKPPNTRRYRTRASKI